MKEQELREKLERIIVETPAEHAIYTVLAEEMVKRIMPTITQYGDHREQEGRIDELEQALFECDTPVKDWDEIPVGYVKFRIKELKAREVKG